MRLRDVFIVIVSVVALIFFFAQSGGIVIEPSFTVAITDTDSMNYYVPRPIVDDLNGDGLPEVLLFPRRDYIAVTPTSRLRRGYNDAFVAMDTQTLAPLSANSIGLATGFLTHPTKKNATHSATPKAIAVVTDDYHLTVYAYVGTTLSERWTTALVGSLTEAIIPYQASITILPDRVFETDVGVIVVAIKTSGPNSTEVTKIIACNGADGEVRWRSTVDHTAPSFIDPNHDGSVLTDISKLKFAPHEIDAAANGLDWGLFRESVVATLPHSFDHLWHHRVVPHKFLHAKNRKKRGANAAAGGSDAAATNKNRHFGTTNDEVYGEVGELARRRGERDPSKAKLSGGAAAREAHAIKTAPNVVVVHGEHAVFVLHLYTGRVVTTFGPLRPGHVYHDLNDDFQVEDVSSHVAATQTFHDRHGVDQAVECRGVITTGAPSSAEALYEASVCDSEGLLSSFLLAEHFVRGDDARDAPTRDPLSLVGSRPVGHSGSAFATPLVVQEQSPHGRAVYKTVRNAVFFLDTGLVTCVSASQQRVLWRADTDARFGVTSATSLESGEASGALHSEDERIARIRAYPHLAAYHFHHRPQSRARSAHDMHRGNDPVVLAVGTAAMAVLDAKTGFVERTVLLPKPPVAPVVIADFNGDGTNDIIVLTREGYYGFLVFQKSSGSVSSVLLLLAVGLLGMLAASQQVPILAASLDEDEAVGAGEEVPTRTQVPRRGKRSTD